MKNTYYEIWCLLNTGKEFSELTSEEINNIVWMSNIPSELCEKMESNIYKCIELYEDIILDNMELYRKSYNIVESLYKKTLSIVSFRNMLCWIFSFSCPTPEIIKTITDFTKIFASGLIEIGAGRGYWSKLLSEKIDNFSSYDNFSWFENEKEKNIFKKYYHVNEGTPEILSSEEKNNKKNDKALLLVWPPYDTSFGADCLKNYSGNLVFYSGEYRGCTGDKEFHSILEKDYILLGAIYPPTIDCVHDELRIYLKKGARIPKAYKKYKALDNPNMHLRYPEEVVKENESDRNRKKGPLSFITSKISAIISDKEL